MGKWTSERGLHGRVADDRDGDICRQYDPGHPLGDLEMTITEAWHRVTEILKTMINGEIRLIIRGGKVKYINCLQEYVPPDPHDRGKTKF